MTLNYPDTGLVDSYQIYRKRKPSITLVVKRDVVSPVLFRNTEPDRSETQSFGDTIHAQVNGEKFVSKERLGGLDLLRELDEDGDLISPEYVYNEPAGLETATNLDALVYGLAGTGEQEFGIKSRVIEGYTFTSDPYDLMNRETHNAVYESGTMQDEDQEQSQSLYERVNIQPGNSFIHFVTLEAGTPAMLLYMLHNVLNTSRYGARETRSGRTLNNQILGVITGEHDTGLSTGELLMSYHEQGDDLADSISEYIAEVSRDDWNVYSDELEVGDSIPEDMQNLIDVAARRTEDADEILRDEFLELTEEGRDVLV